MILSNKKCRGCGAVLNLDKSTVGYVPKLDEHTQMCYRCFQIKHYNKVVDMGGEKMAIEKNLASIVYDKAVCFLITDISDLSNSLLTLKQPAERLVVVVNKMDLLPKGSNLAKLTEQVYANIESSDLCPEHVIFTSIKSKTSLRRLEDLILKYHDQRYNIIFAGQSNVGKSSLINALLKAKKLPNLLITNAHLNTTINFQKINFKDYSIIDTPGQIKNDNLLSYIDAKQIKKITNTETFKPLVYQINIPKTIQIESLVKIDAYPDDKVGSLVLYINPKLNIISSKLKATINWKQIKTIQYINDDVELDTFSYTNLVGKTNFYISGLGILSCNNLSKLEITIHRNINVNQLKAPIF